MKKIVCRKCQKVFLKQNNFQAHCENQNHRPCSTCPVVCCTKKLLEIHRWRVHPSFQCPQCKKYFPRKSTLEKHEHIRRWKKTSCMQCNHSFWKQQRLWDYMLKAPINPKTLTWIMRLTLLKMTLPRFHLATIWWRKVARRVLCVTKCFSITLM